MALSLMPTPPSDRTLFERIAAHVHALAEQTGRDTTIGAVAEALGVSCDDVIAAVDEHGYWTQYDHLPAEPKASWPIFEDGK